MKEPTQTNAKISHLILVLVTLALGCTSSGPPVGSAEAEQVAQNASQSIMKIERKYDQLKKFLNDDEQAVVAAVHQTYQSKLTEWDVEHGEKVRAGQAALADFLSTKNKAKAKQALAQSKKDNVKELILEKRRMQEEYEAAVVRAIPADKLKLWQADSISRTLLEFLEPLDLTAEQIQQVHNLAPSALQTVDDKDKQAWRLIGTSKLEDLVGQRVLSQDQKRPFEELLKNNKSRKLKWAF